MEGNTGTMTGRRVGLCGCGYWGRNLARCFNGLGALKALYDTDVEKARNLPYQLPYVWSSFEEFLDNVDAIVIATPPKTHYDIALQALNAGKDIFIEKPMTTSSTDAEALIEQAKAQGRNLMVGHIYLHNEGIKRIPIPVGKAELYVQLLNERGAPSESTREVAWAGLPHAVSLALHFFPDWPDVIKAQRNGDRIQVYLLYWNGSEVYLDVGDNTGRRLRKVELRIQGSRYLFDVANPNCLNGEPVGVRNPEPLRTECEAFLEYQGVDLMGPKVVKLIEEILDGC